MIWKSHIFYYVVCPRKYYLAFVQRVKVSPTKEMVFGNLFHKVREYVSKNENKILKNVKVMYELEEIVSEYKKYYEDSLNYAVTENARDLERLEIDVEEVNDLLKKDLDLYFISRAIRAKRTMDSLGIEKDELAFYLAPEWNYVEYKIIDKKTGFAGIIDKIIRSKNEFYPVEIKTGKPLLEGVYHPHRIQACFSAILVENKFKIPVNLAFIEYTQINESRPVLIDESLKKEVFKIKEGILEIDNGCVPPKIQKCGQCEYKGVC
ncbi:MAG: Dna2/Cas4 domain-containing protein [Methanomicrobia archaeon]|nr:Dna2/Cas4 domain-containing protein [Methanomicrobia archaeon]